MPFKNLWSPTSVLTFMKSLFNKSFAEFFCVNNFITVTIIILRICCLLYLLDRIYKVRLVYWTHFQIAWITLYELGNFSKWFWSLSQKLCLRSLRIPWAIQESYDRTYLYNRKSELNALFSLYTSHLLKLILEETAVLECFSFLYKKLNSKNVFVASQFLEIKKEITFNLSIQIKLNNKSISSVLNFSL